MKLLIHISYLVALVIGCGSCITLVMICYNNPEMNLVFVWFMTILFIIGNHLNKLSD